MSIVTRAGAQSMPLGTYGWDGGLGSSFRNQPAQEATMLLMANRTWTSPRAPAVRRSFWAAAQDVIAAG